MAATTTSQATSTTTGPKASTDSLRRRNKEHDVRESNIVAAKAIADAVRTSLGPRGMDKMIQGDDGEVIITNDGATILTKMKCHHPAAKMMQELSKSQDVACGDGTTSVVVLAGSLLNATIDLLGKGIHPSKISEAFLLCANLAQKMLSDIARPIELKAKTAESKDEDLEEFVDAAKTALASKVIGVDSDVLAPLAVKAVMKVAEFEDDDRTKEAMVDITESIRIVKQLGGTVDDTEIIEGIVLKKGTGVTANNFVAGPTSIKDAKIGMIQFCLSAPKTDIENNVVISEYAQMDRLLREERKYVLKLCKQIKETGCNVLLIQKSILRDATNELSLHFLAKMKILVVTDIERNDVEFISKTLGCQPVSHIDLFTPDRLGSAEIAEQVSLGSESVIKISVNPAKSLAKTCTVLVRGSNKLVLDEAERSLHDAFCVVRSLIKERFLLVGGGFPETYLSVKLFEKSNEIEGEAAFCMRAFAEALEIIPTTLAENTGMNAIKAVSDLRKMIKNGQRDVGVNVRKNCVGDIKGEKVTQPLLVTLSAIQLACETVRMILKIDDMVGAI